MRGVNRRELVNSTRSWSILWCINDSTYRPPTWIYNEQNPGFSHSIAIVTVLITSKHLTPTRLHAHSCPYRCFFYYFVGLGSYVGCRESAVHARRIIEVVVLWLFSMTLPASLENEASTCRVLRGCWKREYKKKIGKFELGAVHTAVSCPLHCIHRDTAKKKKRKKGPRRIPGTESMCARKIEQTEFK